MKDLVEYKGRTRTFAAANRMRVWATIINNPELAEEHYRQSAAIGMYRCGATWVQIAVALKMSPEYAEAIIKDYLNTNKP